MRINEYSSEKRVLAANQNLKEREYWLTKLSGGLVKSSFPYDYKKTGDEKYQPEQVLFNVPRELSAKAAAAGNHSDHALHIILAAALMILLDKYKNKFKNPNDIIIGTPIYKQESKGEFINTVLPLKIQVHPNKTFKEFLLQTKHTLSESVENQNYPMEMLRQSLNLPTVGEEFPLFDTLILLENIHDKTYIKDIKQDTIFSFLRKETHHLEGMVTYNPLLYKQETINQVINHFQTLLSGALNNGNQRLSHIPILSEEEKQLILFDFNDVKQEFPADKTLVQLFEEQVKKTPAKEAIVFAGERLTYEQLNITANRLAWLLRERGLKTNDIVGVMVERSINMVTCILAVVKAGGAYVPIYPRTPEKRVLSILEDSGARFFLVDDSNINAHFLLEILTHHSNANEPYVTARRPQIKDLDSVPIPDRSLVNYEKYNRFIGQANVKNCITMQASRGCPYKCLYCHKIWPKTHVRRSPETIYNEVKLYYDMGIRRFSFIDDIFNLNITESRQFFQLIIDNGLDIHIYFPNGIRGDILTEDYIDLMVKAGTREVALALESASPRLQKLLKKNLDLEKFRKNTQYFCKAYPNVILKSFNMIGFPTETEEEALMTLDFIKSLKWLHYPYLFILKIYPDTDMEEFALESGISWQAISRSEHLKYHELPDTLPFSKSFVRKLQMDLLNNYFLSKVRLLHILPYQMEIMTEDEMMQMYNSYFPSETIHFKTLDMLLEFAGIGKEELKITKCLDEAAIHVPNFNEKLKKHFPQIEPGKDAFRVLLMDLSQYFSDYYDTLSDLVEPPLGLVYLSDSLKREFASRVKVKITKPMIDFNNYQQLKELLEEFKPDAIGIRTLTPFRYFFHRTTAVIRSWGIDVPIIAGGPYATSSYKTLLHDANIDLAVLGEGEITFNELIATMMENDGKLPHETVLKEIKGIAFMPGNQPRTNRQMLILNELDMVLSQKPRENPGKLNQSTDCVCSIFTSGSTGKPKGVLFSHRGVVRVLRNTNYLTINERDRILQLSNIAFDVSVFDIFGALVNGAALVMIKEEDLFDLKRLTGIIEKEITVFFATSTFFQTIVDFNAQCLKNTRKVICGGEKLSGEHAQKVLESIGKDRLIYVYGPAECSIYATYHYINQIHRKRAVLPIGKLVSNTAIYILDPLLKPVPIGVGGEICLGGDGVTIGYLNRPEFTREKFIPNPFIPGELIYRSGDLGRWLSDGNLEFVGRNDYQVKVRGFRVELGEIESCLLKHRHIMEAVVTAFENKKKVIDLCAYIVPFPGNEIPLPQVRSHLSGELPDYLVPSYFVLMERIPLTPNGKVDRKALPSPFQEGLSTDYDDISPRNEVEARIAQVWQELLNLKNVHIHSSFFEVGGNSIKAIHAASQLSKELDIKVEHIFKYETIANIAQNVSWKTDSLKMKILNLKQRLREGRPGVVDNQKEKDRRKALAEEHQAYLQQVKTEKFPSLTAAHDYQHILITGATGFLGAHLAAELLSSTNAKLHLLVRGNSVETAEAHLKKKLLYYFGENFFENNKHRLKVVCGDLRKNQLGIRNHTYDQLSETIEAIVHSAANNSTYAVYEDLAMNNVKGTGQVLEFALNRRKKDFHFISALTVGDGHVKDKKYILFKEYSHDIGQKLPESREKSKYEAEKKVRLYRKEGLNTSIYRLGDLLFNSQTGKFHENMEKDGFYVRLKAFITLGVVPNVNQLFIDTSFVDFAARAIVTLLTRRNLVNETYHLMNIHSMYWKDMAVLLNKVEENVETVKLEEFLDCLLDCLQTDKYRDLILLHSHFFEEDDNSTPSTSISYAMERTIKLLDTLGFEWAKPDESHIKKMLRFCREVGFLKPV